MRLYTMVKARGSTNETTWEFLGSRAELIHLKEVVEQAIITGVGLALLPLEDGNDLYIKVRREES